MRILPFVVSCAVAATLLKAENVVIAGYENASVLKVEPDGVKILHSRGISKVAFEDLSEELRKKFNLTENTVNQYRKHRESEAEAVKEAKERDARLEKVKLRIRASVLQVVSDGVLLKNIQSFRGRREVAQPVKTGQQPVGVGKTSMNPKADYVAEVVTNYYWEDVWEGYSELMFLEKPLEALGEGKWLEMDVWPIGTYSYTNKLGEERTVELVTSSKERAASHHLK